MPPKKHIIIIGVLCVISLGLGYWYGMPKEGSGGGGNGSGDKEETTAKEPEFLKEGLVAYYPFNGNAKDESGNGNDGIVNGATLTEDRHESPASAFNFKDQSFISVRHNEILNLEAGFTLSVWVKLKSSSLWQRILQKSNGSTGFGYGVMLAANDVVGFTRLKSRGTGSSYRYHISNEGLKKEQWQHVVVIMSDEPDGIVYIDGLSKHVSYGGGDWGGHPGSDLVFGARGGSEKFFQGSIDDVRIYNRALTEAEVKALYEFEKPKTQQASTAPPPRQLTLEEKKVVGVYTRKNRAGTTYKSVFLDNKVVEFYIDNKKRTDIPDDKWEVVDGELHMPSTTPPFPIAVARINNDGFTFIATIKNGERIQKQTIPSESDYHKIK